MKTAPAGVQLSAPSFSAALNVLPAVQEVEQQIAETRASIAAEASAGTRRTTDRIPTTSGSHEMEKPQVHGTACRRATDAPPGRRPAHVGPADQSAP